MKLKVYIDQFYLSNFYFLVFSFSSLLKDDKIIDTVIKFWLIISVVVIFDIFYEKYFGRNILGYVSPNGFRIISFFKDEMVVGGYILCFWFYVYYIFSK